MPAATTGTTDRRDEPTRPGTGEPDEAARLRALGASLHRDPVGCSRPIDDHLDELLRRLTERGVEPDRTLVALSTCRDELVAELARAVDRRWGHPFTLGGLGGLPALGAAGWATALSHVPMHGGRGAVLVLAASHIGVAPDGSLGSTLRVGLDEVSPTCGALVGVRQALLAADDPADADGSGCPFDEHELSGLWTTVSAGLEATGADTPDLAQLTVRLAGQIDEAVHGILGALDASRTFDVAVCSAVHVHHPDGDRMLAVRNTFAGADGVVATL